MADAWVRSAGAASAMKCVWPKLLTLGAPLAPTKVTGMGAFQDCSFSLPRWQKCCVLVYFGRNQHCSGVNLALCFLWRADSEECTWKLQTGFLFFFPVSQMFKVASHFSVKLLLWRMEEFTVRFPVMVWCCDQRGSIIILWHWPQTPLENHYDSKHPCKMGKAVIYIHLVYGQTKTQRSHVMSPRLQGKSMTGARIGPRQP